MNSRQRVFDEKKFWFQTQSCCASHWMHSNNHLNEHPLPTSQCFSHYLLIWSTNGLLQQAFPKYLQLMQDGVCQLVHKPILLYLCAIQHRSVRRNWQVLIGQVVEISLLKSYCPSTCLIIASCNGWPKATSPLSFGNLRTTLLILAVVAMGGAWLLEQPRSSVVTWHPRIRLLWRLLPKDGEEQLDHK